MFEIGDNQQLIPGCVGKLEAIITVPKEIKIKAIAFICHPHPLFQGTMNNKVIYTLAKTYRELGIPSIRFNFRGVGSSEGSYAEALGETDDLLAVIEFAKKHFPKHPLLLNGFSFGSFVAYRACTMLQQKENIKFLLTIAPPVHHFDFQSLPEIKCPWLVLQGEADEVVPKEDVYQWIASLTKPPVLIKFPEVGHFFHGQLVRLQQTIIDNFPL